VRKTKDISLLWLLCSQSFTVGSLLISYWSFTCLHNGFIFCKISHVQNALCNGEEHIIDIFMMVRVLCKLALSIFANVETWWLMFLFLLNSMIALQTIDLGFHSTSMVCPLSRVWLQWFFFVESFEVVNVWHMLTWLDFLGHLCWNGQFQGFNSLASPWVYLSNLMVHLFIQSFALLFANVDPYKKQFITVNTIIWDK
jgi:hypothetical protein